MKNIELSLIMKTNKILAFFTVVLTAFALTSCVQDDDFSVPTSQGNEENARLNQLLATSTEVTIDYAKGLYDNDPDGDNNNDDAIPFYVENDIYVKGYVTSSDQTGNFYKEFFIQDAPNNPTTGLKVILNQVDTYNQFNKGREVYINLKGLYIGEERTGNNVVTIGGGTESDQYGSTVTQLTQNQIGTNLLRSEITMEVEPLVVGFSAISDDHIGLFVQVNDVEFADDLIENNLRYFDPAQDFDTQRTMQRCTGFDYSTFSLETSSFSSFKEELLPTGNGTIKAVVSKTYNASSLILALNTTDDVDFSNSRCELLNIEDFTTIFEENFTAGQGAWEVTNTVGTRQWGAASFSGEYYMRASAFQGSSNPIAEMVSWLISPAIDFDAQGNELLVLEVADAYSNGQPLKAFYSEDYTTGSDPSTATWIEIGASQLNGLSQNTGFYDNNYEETEFIDLSMVSGNAVVAFVYDSNDGTISTTIDLSNVLIIAQ